ncbi:hypothetical protein ACN08S_11230 (plasmid) [Photobacterium leiognathi subsp. mandapamensis]|jgi:uncharacterized protein Usg|uniref:hypothetical protein n=1 Tax=Photobacterium leiognathi TaxID=553611 RepID=UPI003AF39540
MLIINNSGRVKKKRRFISSLDKYKWEIITLHNDLNQSIGFISFWLEEKHGVLASKDAIKKRLRYWNGKYYGAKNSQ